MDGQPLTMDDGSDGTGHVRRVVTASQPRLDPVDSVPFACQHGSNLYLLEASGRFWTLAELKFDPSACAYTEVRRIRYRWAREATGALLGRVFAFGRPAAEETARSLAAWIAATPPYRY